MVWGSSFTTSNMIRSFFRSLFRPAPRVLREVSVPVMVETPALTVAELVALDRAAGLSIRAIAKKHSLSYYMARKMSQAA